jgi:hypothetical protein
VSDPASCGGEAGSERDREKDRQSAAWKFDLLETLNADPKANGSCLKVMAVYLKYADSESRQAFVSNSNLTIRAAVSKPTAQTARETLEKLGYLVPRYRVGDGAMLYRITNARRELITDHLHIALQVAAEAARERKLTARKKASDLGKKSCPPETAEGERNLPPEWKDSFPNSLDTIPEVSSSEGKDRSVGNQYAAVSGDDPHLPFPIPTSEAEAVEMMTAIFSGRESNPAFLTYFRRKLMDGRLTPADVECHLKEFAA